MKYKKGDINSSELAKRVSMNRLTVSSDLLLLTLGISKIKEGDRNKTLRISSIKNTKDKEKIFKKIEVLEKWKVEEEQGRKELTKNILEQQKILKQILENKAAQNE